MVWVLLAILRREIEMQERFLEVVENTKKQQVENKD